jgi:hypothetical protein
MRVRLFVLVLFLLPAVCALERPHEPVGMTTQTDRGFEFILCRYNAAPPGCVDPPYDGWDDIEALQTNLNITTDPSAPASPPSVIQWTYPQGFVGGSSPATIQHRIPSGTKAVYFDLSTKISSNWWGENSSTNKMLFVWINNGAKFFISAEGNRNGPLQPQLRIQGTNIDARRRFIPNANTTPVWVERGQWQRWEVLLVANTPGQLNGQIYWWLDGQLISNYTDIGFVNSTESSDWNYFAGNPIYGGGATVVPETQYLWWDNVYISTLSGNDTVNATQTAATTGSITLAWPAPTGNVTHFRIYKNGAPYTNVTSTTFTDASLLSNTNYTYKIAPVNGLGYEGTGTTIVASTSATATGPGDVNGDRIVNLADILLVSSRLDSSTSTYDLNSDGIVNIFDLIRVTSYWGSSY